MPETIKGSTLPAMVDKVIYLRTTVFCLVVSAGTSAWGQDAEPRNLFQRLCDRWLRVTISEETTHITRPVGADGYIDYLAALNELSQKNVPKNQNAAILLWDAVGPSNVFGEDRSAYFSSANFKLLGDAPSEDGDYFESFVEYTERAAPEKLLPQAYERLLSKMYGKQPWTERDVALGAKWLRENEVPLEKAKQASLQKRYYSPIMFYAAPEEHGVGYVDIMYEDPLAPEVNRLGWALIARTMLSAGEGRLNAACDDLLAAHRLARLVAQGPFLVHYQIGIQLERAALDAWIGLLCDIKLDLTQLANARARCRVLDPLPRLSEKLDNGERLAFLALVSRMPRKRLGFFLYVNPRYKYKALMWWPGVVFLWTADWDEILRRSNEWFDERVVAAETPSWQARSRAHSDISDKMRDALHRTRYFFEVNRRRNPWVVVLRMRQLATDTINATLSLLISSGPPFDLWDEIDAKKGMVNVVIALRMYHLKHDTYPRELQQLKPEFLGAVPQDPFADAPLRYRRLETGFVLYSIGPNGRDDGGEKSEHSNVWDDIAVTFPGN